MSKLQELRKRAEKAKQRFGAIESILAKNKELPENFGGEEILQILDASEITSTVLLMIDLHLQQIAEFIEDSPEANGLEDDFENYLNRLEPEIPNLEEAAKLEPAKFTLREALAEIAERDEKIKALEEKYAELEKKLSTEDIQCALKLMKALQEKRAQGIHIYIGKPDGEKFDFDSIFTFFPS